MGIEISLETYDEGGDLTPLLKVNWPAIPREGETVILEGPEFGESAHETETLFEVHEIVWRASKENPDEGPTVVLAIPRGHSTFVPKCTCPEEATEETPEDTDRCPNCLGRIV